MAKKKARKKTATKKAAKKKVAKKTKKVSPVPAGYTTVTPHLVCREAAQAIAFYVKAFGAKERMRMASPDGKIAHAEIRIGNAIVMLGDEQPAMGASAPQTVGGTAVHIFLYVPNIDKLFAQAVQAGATVEMPPTNMFWGDRYAKLSDPFGHKWSLGTHIEDVSPKEMGRRMAEASKQQQ